ncbi:Delta 8-(E)-sphingolipid desaturase [Hyphodiscus hymeniophilus]|uniref:Delta 8-(E)-sphingolipid desaturase n=1 Tax=Hyphodiscus hymeniophilus TaxID=353542 RepID=A0A9P6VNE5_9HELO|nr:Delta 8-(E)-sphingolipid desaturase [Hyphodiscus hymeniophilus]
MNRILSRRQIEGRLAENELIVIFRDNVLRLDKWIEKHPGVFLLPSRDNTLTGLYGLLSQGAISEAFGAKDGSTTLTRNVNSYHSTETLRMMTGYRIGRINGSWVNFEPPVSGGIFRPSMEARTPSPNYRGRPCIQSLEKPATTNDGRSKVRLVRFLHDEESASRCQDLSSVKKRVDSMSTVSHALSKDPTQNTPADCAEHAEQLEIDLAVQTFPSVDSKSQREIISKYRELHRAVAEGGHYDCRYTEYAKECVRYTVLLALAITALRYEWYLSSAVLLGCFWQQIMFSAHDAGHLAITHNYTIDSLIGIFVADFCCGLSIGWWKSSHNVHHLVPNHPLHDPDIQNIPLFATSPAFFKSIVSSYYNMTFVWDKAAEIAVQYQKYTYYPIMCVARFNLYILSWLHLISARSRSLASSSWTRPVELLAMACYWYMFGYLLLWKSIPTWTLRVAFVLVSHITTMPLHIQITLSHWGMSTADLGPTESFAQKQLRTTMDIDCPAWLDFVHGGLQFQAVHHLFPRVPRHNLRRVQALVKEFCKDVGIEYVLFGFVDGNKVVLSRLEEISKQVETLSACQSWMIKTGESGLH